MKRNRKKKKKVQKFSWKVLYKEKRSFFLFCSFLLIPFCYLVITVIFYSEKFDRNPFIIAEKKYANWKKGDDNSWKELNHLFMKNPILQNKYQGQITQELLRQSQVQQAISLANISLSKTQEDIPAYVRFSKTSLSISQCLYEQALQEAQALKNDIISICQENQMMFLNFYNLLRIAFLEKSLGHKKEELLAWQEFEQYLENSKNDIFIQKLSNQFTKKSKISLFDYIQYRKKILQ